MRTEKATKTITQSGDSLVINVTREVKRLGLGRGDNVDLELFSTDGDLKQLIKTITGHAIASRHLKTVPAGYSATRADVERIAQSVSDCLPSNCRVLVYEDDNDATALYMDVEIVYNEGVPLKTWGYLVNFYLDHA